MRKSDTFPKTKSLEPTDERDASALNSLISAIAQQIEQARGQIRQAVNSTMVQSYWQVGRLIVEHEQQGNSRAEYGKQQLQQLSKQLTERLGKGFDVTNCSYHYFTAFFYHAFGHPSHCLASA